MKTPVFIKKIFILLGWAGMFAGLFSLSYAWLELKPRLARVTDQVQSDLSDLDSLTQGLKKNDSPTARLVHLMPNTVATLHGTLVTTSQTLYGTAKTTNDVKKGVTGLIMPKTALGIDTNRLSNTGYQLKLFADVVEQMEEPVTQLSNDFTGITSQVDKISSRIGGLRDAVDHAALPFQASLLASAFSILYFLFGGFCFAFAYAAEALLTNKIAPENSEHRDISSAA